MTFLEESKREERRREKMLELSSLFLTRPATQRLSAFLASIKTNRTTWLKYLEEPWFRERIRAIEATRVHVALDVFRQSLEKVQQQVVRDATTAIRANDRTAAARLIIDSVKGAVADGTSIRIVNNNLISEADSEKTIEELLAERDELNKIIERDHGDDG